MIVRTVDGRTLTLGGKIAAGGEGAIHIVEGLPEMVAKIYFRRPPPDLQNKLRAMVTIKPIDHCAWPRELIIHERHGLVGFIMPFVRHRRELQTVISPLARKQYFPDVSYRFVVHVARNLARAMASVHESGVIVGDVNERFALVGDDGTVTLIDCDSYQIRHSGSTFPCNVGVPTYQPAELQGLTTFRGVCRLRNHDVFGLAVLIFQLLFLGRHPFAGRHESAGDVTIPSAIQRYLFAFDPTNRATIKPPRGSLTLKAVSPKLAEYFCRAFGEQGRLKGRPTAAAWARTLEEFERGLRRCANASTHWYIGTQCALCRLERATGTVTFHPPLPSGATGQHLYASMQVETKRARQAIAKAMCAQLSPPKMLAAARRIANTEARGWEWVAAWFRRKIDPRAEAIRNQIKAVLVEYDQLSSQYQSSSREHGITSLKQRLEILVEEIDRSQREYSRRAKDLVHSCRATMARCDLASYSIRDARLPGIGVARAWRLATHGIHTAKDVSRDAILAVNGFGPELATKLTKWRQQIEDNIRTLGKNHREKTIQKYNKRLDALRSEHKERIRIVRTEITKIRLRADDISEFYARTDIRLRILSRNVDDLVKKYESLPRAK